MEECFDEVMLRLQCVGDKDIVGEERTSEYMVRGAQ